MEIRHLQGFLQVAQLGRLGAAARRLHVTQPALSRQIKQLEDELGVELFRRTGRGMALTEAGALLEERAGPLLDSLRRVAEEVQQRAHAVRGTVTLAVPPSVGAGMAADIVERCRAEYPELTLRLIVLLSGAVHEGLLRGRFDLGILYEPLPRAELTVERLWRERLWCVAGYDSELRAEQPVALADVLDYPLVLPGPRHGLRMFVEGQAVRHARRSHAVVEVDSLRVLVELVRRGVGRTLLPPHAIRTELDAQMVRIAPVIRPVLRRTTLLGWPRANPPSPATEAVAVVIRQLAKGAPTR